MSHEKLCLKGTSIKSDFPMKFGNRESIILKETTIDVVSLVSPIKKPSLAQPGNKHLQAEDWLCSNIVRSR